MATKKRKTAKRKTVKRKTVKRKAAPKRKASPVCSGAGRSLAKKGTRKAGKILGSRTCCKKAGSGKKCVRKGRAKRK